MENWQLGSMTIVEARNQSPLVLAYIGDAVLELAVRTRILTVAKLRVHDMHKKAVKYVQAGSQSKAYLALVESLTEEELNIAKRGRNAKSGYAPKNISVSEYRMATGFEALMGFLYLIGNKDRMEQVLSCLYNIVEGEA